MTKASRQPLTSALASQGLTLTLGTAGALVAWSLSLPLAFLVGPALVMLFASRALPALTVSPVLRALALVVIGAYLGSRFTPDLAAQMPLWAASLTLNAVMTVVTTCLGTIVLMRAFGYDPSTAAFAALPGGILSVLEVARQSDADQQAVMFLQVFRVALGTIALPFIIDGIGFDIPSTGLAETAAQDAAPLAQLALLMAACIGAAAIGRKIRFPSAELVAPMLLSATLYATGTVTAPIPGGGVIVSFIIVGTAVGATLPRPDIKPFLRLILHTGMVFTLMCGLTLIFAYGVHLGFGVSMIEAFLAFAPAGMTEMTAMAAALHLDPGYVAANNLVRLSLCSLLAPVILLGLKARARRG